MSKLRLLFVKEAQASYISHLDLMRTFQRCFPRTELDIKHTQGYHPHPIISIVLPLPVGQSSDCELLDFEVTQTSDGSGIAEKLNTGMPIGIRVLDCYEAKRPIRELDSLRADVTLEYDAGVPEGAAERLRELLARDTLVIQKRTKRKELADVEGGRDGGRAQRVYCYHCAGPESRPESPADGKGYRGLSSRTDAGLCPRAPPCHSGRERAGFSMIFPEK